MQKIKLTIAGKEYAFRFDGSADLLTKTADELNMKISQLKEKSNALELEESLILVSLNEIAESLEGQTIPKALEMALHSEKEKVQKLLKEIENLKNKPDFKKLSNKLSRLEAENKMLKAKRDGLLEQTKILTIEVEKLKAENEINIKNAEVLEENNSDNADYVAEIEDLKNKLVKANAEISRLTDKLLQIQGENKILEQKNKELIEITEKSCTKNDDEILAQMIKLEEKASTAQLKVADLVEQLDFSDKLNFKLANDIQLLELQLNELRHESDGKGKFCSDIEARCKRLEIENDDLRKMNDAYKIRLREIVEDGQLML